MSRPEAPTLCEVEGRPVDQWCPPCRLFHDIEAMREWCEGRGLYA